MSTLPNILASGDLAMLTGEMFEIRKKHVTTYEDLDEVQDTIHAFYQCPKCGRDSIELTVLTGDVMGLMNNVPAMLEMLSDEPEKLIHTPKPKCNCKTFFKPTKKLTRAIFCRTNPSQRNDFHFTFDYGLADAPIALSVLHTDGRYEQAPETAVEQILGREVTPPSADSGEEVQLIGETLRTVGYDPTGQQLELSCYLDPQQNIPEEEFANLRTPDLD